MHDTFAKRIALQSLLKVELSRTCNFCSTEASLQAHADRHNTDFGCPSIVTDSLP